MPMGIISQIKKVPAQLGIVFLFSQVALLCCDYIASDLEQHFPFVLIYINSTQYFITLAEGRAVCQV